MAATLEEIQKAVESFNLKAHAETDEWSTPVTVRTDGVIHVVEWAGFCLYDSGQDERDFDEEKDEWEPLRDYLLNQMVDRVEDLKTYVSALQMQWHKPLGGCTAKVVSG